MINLQRTRDRREWFLTTSIGPPEVVQLLTFDEVDLLAKPQAIHCHQRVMAGVRRTAQGVLDDDDAKAEIHRVHYGRQHADVRFGARNDDRSNLLFEENIGERRPKERRVRCLVDDRSRWRVPRELGDKIELRAAERLSRCDLPTLEVWPPLAQRLLRPAGRDKACKDRSRGIAGRKVRYHRKHPFHPRRFPNPALCKDKLHIDAEMDGILDRLHGGNAPVPDKASSIENNPAERRSARQLLGGAPRRALVTSAIMAADAFVRPMRRLEASDAAAESRLVPLVTVAHDLVASPRRASITEKLTPITASTAFPIKLSVRTFHLTHRQC